jgi:hypothetical protein
LIPGAAVGSFQGYCVDILKSGDFVPLKSSRFDADKCDRTIDLRSHTKAGDVPAMTVESRNRSREAKKTYLLLSGTERLFQKASWFAAC